MKDRLQGYLFLLSVVGAGIFVAFAAIRWLGWSREVAEICFYLTIAAVILDWVNVSFFLAEKEAEVVEERNDPDFGELTLFRRSWRSHAWRAILRSQMMASVLFLGGDSSGVYTKFGASENLVGKKKQIK